MATCDVVLTTEAQIHDRIREKRASGTLSANEIENLFWYCETRAPQLLRTVIAEDRAVPIDKQLLDLRKIFNHACRWGKCFTVFFLLRNFRDSVDIISGTDEAVMRDNVSVAKILIREMTKDEHFLLTCRNGCSTILAAKLQPIDNVETLSAGLILVSQREDGTKMIKMIFDHSIAIGHPIPPFSIGNAILAAAMNNRVEAFRFLLTCDADVPHDVFARADEIARANGYIQIYMSLRAKHM